MRIDPGFENQIMNHMDTSRSAVQRRIEEFGRACADAGLARTPQRLAIYGLLAADPSHPTAEQVFRRLKPEVPSLSLGTVYRTLELLAQHGLIQRVLTGGAQARFDANLDEHHHLVCVRCHAVNDYEADDLPVPVVRRVRGFRVLSRRVQWFGICQRCQPGRSRT